MLVAFNTTTLHAQARPASSYAEDRARMPNPHRKEVFDGGQPAASC